MCDQFFRQPANECSAQYEHYRSVDRRIKKTPLKQLFNDILLITTIDKTTLRYDGHDDDTPAYFAGAEKTYACPVFETTASDCTLYVHTKEYAQFTLLRFLVRHMKMNDNTRKYNNDGG